MTDQEDKELSEKFEKRFAELPKVIQDAITSADIEKRLRELADTNKLHLDQWVALENEVMLALYGFQPVEELQQNIKKELGVSDEIAGTLTADISRIVFEPIRQELERELEHPEAKAKLESDVEAARTQTLSAESAQGPTPITNTEPDPGPLPQVPVQLSTPPVAPSPPPESVAIPAVKPTENSELAIKPIPPATPPPPPPTERAVRAPTTSVYKPGESSTARANVHDDPYREPPA